MIEARVRLDGPDLERLADLERRVVDADGGRLKLEWATLRSRTGAAAADLIVRSGDSLVGFAGLYPFSGSIEIAGMVDPAHRRRGFGSALLTEARAVCAGRGVGRVLVVVPRTTDAGLSFVRRHGASFDHSEHALELCGDAMGPTRPDVRLTLRPAGAADAPRLTELLVAAFEQPGTAAPARTQHPAGTVVVELDGRLVATLRVERDGPAAGIYGFAVDPDWQGRGIGRDVLARTCARLRRDGVERVGLEVAVGNERALRLYTAVGFRARLTEDYWALRTGGSLRAQ